MIKLKSLIEGRTQYFDNKEDIIEEAIEHWRGGHQYLKVYYEVDDIDDGETEVSITFRVNKDHARNPSRNESDHNYSLVGGEGRDSYVETDNGINIQEFIGYEIDEDDLRKSLENFMWHVNDFHGIRN